MIEGSYHTEETRKKMIEAKKCVSEGTRKKISEANRGKPSHRKGKCLSMETRKRMSEALIGNTHLKGHNHSEESKKKISQSLTGVKHSEEGRMNQSASLIGHKVSEETRKKISMAQKGEKSRNWEGGKSFLPYPLIWNEKLKQFIKDRDNNECQNPYCKSNSKRLAVHHINYDKDNCLQFNLIALCNSCNAEANHNKREWQRLYKKIIWSKY